MKCLSEMKRVSPVLQKSGGPSKKSLALDLSINKSPICLGFLSSTSVLQF
jgi:hypothetical protein